MEKRPVTIMPCSSFKGTVRLPGDKSISHRAALCAALASGRTRITNFLFCDDCQATLRALRQMRVRVAADPEKECVTVEAQGFLRPPKDNLNMGESGTSARILMGLLSSQPFTARLDGRASLRRRPMGRVIEPLRRMGAVLEARRDASGNEFLPVAVFPSKLKGIAWRQKIASAQVKSAVLLAALSAAGATRFKESVVSRDHTERMLKLFGAKIRRDADEIRLEPSRLTSPGPVAVPGDFSSAAFFIVAGLLAEESELLIKGVNLNPTRIGLLWVLKRMGARIRVLNRRFGFEPVADLQVRSSRLRATTVGPHEIATMIDELPVLLVAASRAQGTTVIKGAGELRVKETDRIESMRWNLSKLGVSLQVRSLNEREDLFVQGVRAFPGASFKSFGDHRTAMSLFVAGLVSKGPSRLDDTACISKSFPGFLCVLKHLIAQ